MVSCVLNMMGRSLSFKNWEPDGLNKGGDNVSPKTSAIIRRPSDETVSLSIPTQPPESSFLPPSLVEYCSPKSKAELDDAATRVQKCFKSYRTRRNLADCAVIAEESWWKALDFTSLQLYSIFDAEKQTAASRWSRAKKRLAKVGKGLSKDEKAQSLALRHWLEAIDPRHRYGHNLHFYYDAWFASESTQPFFYWLDIGEGRELNLEKISRTRLQTQMIAYLGPKERESYEVIVEDGKLVYKMNEKPVNTTEGSKWIFVLSTSRALYVGEKKKGLFQHSSFLAGAATTAAGRLVAKEGVLKAIWPYSGHYLPTQENFREFIRFLQEHEVDLTNVKKNSIDVTEPETEAETAQSTGDEKETEEHKTDNTMAHELNRRLSCKWSTGTGARIGIVRDYPAEIQSRALEQVNLSPRVIPSPASRNKIPIPSPRPSPTIRVSPRLQYMGIPMLSPRPSPKTRLSSQAQYMGIPHPNVSLTLPKMKRG